MKTCNCTRHVRAIPYTISPLITLEEEYDKDRTPRSRRLGLIRSPSIHLDPSSTQPRLIAGQKARKADMTQDPESFHCLILYVTMVSRDGRPFSRYVATATSAAIDKTSSGVSASSYPIKRQAGGSTKGADDERQTTKDLSPFHHRRSTS
jgi:hypothetical protein